jgi:Rps23 Pro-64 3,4-dihydroxylase Tpa1-like proline 4-hydroxylase
MKDIKTYMAQKISEATMVKKPVDHLVIHDFLPHEFAEKLSEEFPDWDSKDWHTYKNAIEDKKTCNQWNLFKSATYMYFMIVSDPEISLIISDKFNIEIAADIGLHGGGQHCHSSSGNLNPHLDYSIHPKLGQERRINAICYLADDYNEEDGGHFGLWGNDNPKVPGDLVAEVSPKFNSAVIFNTSQNSWHGMSRVYNPKVSKLRKSLANYYVSEPRDNALGNTRALFAPRDEQKNDQKVIDQIAARADETKYGSVYIVED